jgi:tyrosyl-tRNA synthetase
MQAISAFSKAKYRIGSNVADNIDYNDAMIDTGSRNDLNYLIEQIDFYLRSIK